MVSATVVRQARGMDTTPTSEPPEGTTATATSELPPGPGTTPGTPPVRSSPDRGSTVAGTNGCWPGLPPDWPTTSASTHCS